MHAATVRTFGEAKDVLSVSDIQVPGPLMIEPGTGKMLLRVLACSTSPGDWRTFRGDVDFIRRPAFPYVPSGDICGIVMQVDGSCPRFRVGDCVVATWTETPLSGMAEYAVVDCQLAIPKPTGLSVVEAAALPNSSLHALDVLREANVTPGERVLVLGGSGGVGTALVQLVKRKTGASFVATTSTQTELMYSLGADRVVDHEHENWWDLPEFVDSQAFDVVIDCAEGLEGWERAKRSAAVKPGVLGGRFIAVSSDEPRMQIHNAQQMASFASTMLLREPFYKLRAASTPSWRMYLGGATPESLAELSSIVEEGWFRVVVDPRGPFPFTTDGVRAAYDLQASFHAHGKVVVQMDLDAQLQ
jgi:2-methylene-furan-3-one reductase